jgi:hypothetical protein
MTQPGAGRSAFNFGNASRAFEYATHVVEGVDVKSAVKQGSTFAIYLPLALALNILAAAVSARAPPSRR